MRKTIKDSVLSVVKDLHRDAAVDQLKLRELKTICDGLNVKLDAEEKKVLDSVEHSCMLYKAF